MKIDLKRIKRANMTGELLPLITIGDTMGELLSQSWADPRSDNSNREAAFEVLIQWNCLSKLLHDECVAKEASK
jgi:hypothetical protein